VNYQTQQLRRLRAFLAAATVNNVVAAEICYHYGLQVGLPAECNNATGNTAYVPSESRKLRKATLPDGLAAVQHYADRLLATDHSQYPS
jgi:hypothetical protein